MLPIKGIQKTTLIDYPGVIASTIFIGGCNFRCPFCHNVSLVNDIDALPTIPEVDMIEYVRERKKYIDGICITGGEPLLYPELKGFVQVIKDAGYLVKLDTNGTNPQLLEDMMDLDLLDYIAMDIKAPKAQYAAAAGVPVDISLIEKSVELIKQGRVPYEFRTTVVPRLFPKQEVPSVGEWLKGSDRYYLQQFSKQAELLDSAFREEVVYSKKDLEDMAEQLRAYIKKVEIR